jgi:hypothetical protein
MIFLPTTYMRILNYVASKEAWVDRIGNRK